MISNVGLFAGIGTLSGIQDVSTVERLCGSLWTRLKRLQGPPSSSDKHKGNSRSDKRVFQRDLPVEPYDAN